LEKLRAKFKLDAEVALAQLIRLPEKKAAA
jgi:hypothetical protein